MFYKKIFLFFLLFPLFFLEFHFSFQEIGKTSSLISVKQAFSDLEKDTDPCLGDNCDTASDHSPQKTIAQAGPLAQTNLSGSDSGDTAKCGNYSEENIYKYSPKELKNKIKGVEREANRIKENTSTITIESSTGKVTKQIYDTKAADACYKIKDSLEEALGAANQCKEELETAEKAKMDFSKDCSQFSGKLFQCSSAVKACANCADGVDYGGYDCVKVHNKTKCPALSGAELKAAKEKRDKASEEIEKFQEKIKDLEEDIVSKENELNEALSELDEEFTEANRKLERQVEELKADLEHQLKKNKAQITKVVSESIAKVQAEIDNFLKVAHTFENALTKAHREYRKERRQITSECEVQAQGRLSQYRKKRKAAILSGSLKIPLSSLLNNKRATFGQTDARLVKKYYSQCLAKRKPDFQEIYSDLRQKLRLIEQQKEQYQAQLNKAKQRIADLNNQAAQEQNKQLKEYTASMNKILASHQKETYALNLKYFKSKQALLTKTRAINVLKKHRTEHSLMLQEKQMELVHEQGLISYLKQMGVEEEGKESEFTQAAGSYSEYEGAVRIAYSSCGCANNEREGFLSKKCNSMKKIFKILEDLDLEEDDDATPKEKKDFKPSKRHKKNNKKGSI